MSEWYLRRLRIPVADKAGLAGEREHQGQDDGAQDADADEWPLDPCEHLHTEGHREERKDEAGRRADQHATLAVGEVGEALQPMYSPRMASEGLAIQVAMKMFQ